MLSAELVCGRRVAVVLQPGDDVIRSIVDACILHRIRQGYIAMFLGAFRSARLIATTNPATDPEPPLGAEVTVAYTEGTGSGSIVWNADAGEPRVHLHVALGVKDEGGLAYAGHLLGAVTHYTAELVIDEVLAPTMVRVADEQAFGLENLVFRPGP
ncbi:MULTISPECIES: PPC domain-containing DNA-binding protein [Subtercola]|uniref:DUF296 domain-containing protein n=1 Tax=Subtercola vilae TaxID=2056433 RepID=A0A4T2C3B3_9MICO|nr:MULTISPECIES: DUF296 domain-containing protein [Subtercola]MEA9985152.1 DUF296 domain-containing protein [Subtercola sp. RTI3]TIH37651.1 DUF296 domain-containing protein [Subtercola vilae]